MKRQLSTILATVLTLSCVGLIAVSGCKKSEEKKESPEATTSPDTPETKPESKPDTPPEPVELTADEAIPTTADFEEAAANELTVENLEAELAKLEDELDDQ